MEGKSHAQATGKGLGLSRVPIICNADYQPNGTRSYVSAIARYGFQPSKPGPYSYKVRMHQRGLANSSVPAGGRVRMERTLMKNSEAASGPVAVVASDDQQNDPLYLCEVQVGTPPQRLKLELNTGSCEFWVLAPGAGGSAGAGAFDPRRSSTYQSAVDKTWAVKQGDGSSLSGEVGTDKVAVGGIEISDLSIELAVRLEGQQPARRTADGCFGLSIPDTKAIRENGLPDPQKTFVAKMASRPGIAKDTQLFTTAMYGTRDERKDQSFCTFGHVDQGMVSAGGGNISWAAVDSSKGFWMFHSEKAGVHDSPLPRPGNQAIADTSSPLVLVADDVCDAFYGQIEGARYSEEHQGFVIPKGVEAKDLPELRLAVGDAEVVFAPEEHLFAEAGSKLWYGAVQSRGDNAFDVFGNPFLRSVYAIWDYGNGRFGFVPMAA